MQLETLRANIRRLEAMPEVGPHGAENAMCEPWSFGAVEIDGLLGEAGLDVDGVHEFKPAFGDEGSPVGGWAAAQGMVLALAARRLAAMEHGSMLWCQTGALAREFGCLYGGGLSRFGLDPERVLVALPERAQDVLWCLEEGLNASRFSGTRLALVVGLVEDVQLTPARRLALAAGKNRTPCLLVTSPRSLGVAATLTRWRVAAGCSGVDTFAPGAPGAFRCRLALERCRARAVLAGEAWFRVEWSDEAYRFCVASDVADRADAADGGLARAG
ncbi:MAG: hypothetical protein RLZ98_2250 [Pseudomonadota bacterium]